jgi:hypothetical protein
MSEQPGGKPRRCEVCGGEPFMICPGPPQVILCMDCMFYPGRFGGMDHPLPDNPEMCAHRHSADRGEPRMMRYLP